MKITDPTRSSHALPLEADSIAQFPPDFPADIIGEVASRLLTHEVVEVGLDPLHITFRRNGPRVEVEEVRCTMPVDDATNWALRGWAYRQALLVIERWRARGQR
jgi:hypothetical protein